MSPHILYHRCLSQCAIYAGNQINNNKMHVIIYHTTIHLFKTMECIGNAYQEIRK